MDCILCFKDNVIKLLKNYFFWFFILSISAFLLLYFSSNGTQDINNCKEFAVALFSFAGIFLVQWIFRRYNQIQFLKEIRQPLLKYAEDVLTEFNFISDFSEFDSLDIDSFKRKKHEILSKLQLLIHIGRLHFPNDKKSEYGFSKIHFRRGYRPLPLDAIMVVYELVKSIDFDNLKELSKNNSPIFIAQIQRASNRMHSLYYKNEIMQKEAEEYTHVIFIKNISRIFAQEVCFYGKLDDWEKFYAFTRPSEIDRF